MSTYDFTTTRTFTRDEIVAGLRDVADDALAAIERYLDHPQTPEPTGFSGPVEPELHRGQLAKYLAAFLIAHTARRLGFDAMNAAGQVPVLIGVVGSMRTKMASQDEADALRKIGGAG